MHAYSLTSQNMNFPKPNPIPNSFCRLLLSFHFNFSILIIYYTVSFLQNRCRFIQGRGTTRNTCHEAWKLHLSISESWQTAAHLLPRQEKHAVELVSEVSSRHRHHSVKRSWHNSELVIFATTISDYSSFSFHCKICG